MNQQLSRTERKKKQCVCCFSPRLAGPAASLRRLNLFPQQLLVYLRWCWSTNKVCNKSLSGPLETQREVVNVSQRKPAKDETVRVEGKPFPGREEVLIKLNLRFLPLILEQI